MTALYGSLQNRLMERADDTKPEIGMGATKLSYTDRDPYTIIEVISPCKIKVQEDKAESIGKEYYSQEWKITPNPEGRTEILIKTKKGWKIPKSCTYFRIGMRQKYFDYSF